MATALPVADQRTHRRSAAAQLWSELTHDPGEPRGRLWAVGANSIAGTSALPARVRTMMYRALGLRISMRAMVRPGVIFRTPLVTVGPGSTINYRCVFDNRSEVSIGAHVGVGIGVTFVTSTHELTDPAQRAGAGTTIGISVGDGCWIGSGATILPGVQIGPGVVVAAGSVVNRDCLAHGVYAGVPARRIKELPAPLE